MSLTIHTGQNHNPHVNLHNRGDDKSKPTSDVCMLTLQLSHVFTTSFILPTFNIKHSLNIMLDILQLSGFIRCQVPNIGGVLANIIWLKGADFVENQGGHSELF